MVNPDLAALVQGAFDERTHSRRCRKSERDDMKKVRTVNPSAPLSLKQRSRYFLAASARFWMKALRAEM
jgi:hypothetical protein